MKKITIYIAMILAWAANAQAANCPANKDNVPLDNVSVFDGPPEDMTDLVPDTSSGDQKHGYASWEVSHVYAAGHSVFLVCHYGDEKVTIKVQKKSKNCVFHANAPAPAEASCM